MSFLSRRTVSHERVGPMEPMVNLLKAIADLNEEVIRLAARFDQSSSESLVYSVEQAAEVLGVSRSKMYDLLHRPDFPVVDLGHRRVIPRKQLSAWLDQQCMKKAR